MKAIGLGVRCAAFALALGLSVATPTVPVWAAGMPVFDATNYTENLLQAARALEQINNQVKSLQNEAGMLQNMAKNLARIDFPQLDRMTSAMQSIDRLMGQAQGVDFRIDRLDERVRALFPGELQRLLTRDERAGQARARLDSAAAAFRQAMTVQAQVAENARSDAGLLAELAAASQSAEGALQASQAANQLLALSIKQQLQLQNLMATEYRSQSLDRARRMQGEEDGRTAVRRFLDGTGRTARN